MVTVMHFDENITSGHPRFGARALQLPFSASNEPILDLLDTFSDATDEINTLVLLVLRHLHPIVDSQRSPKS
jgi:hypothetical protein